MKQGFQENNRPRNMQFLKEKTLSYFFFLCTAATFLFNTCALFAKDWEEAVSKQEIKEIQKEAKKIGKEQNEAARDFLEKLFQEDGFSPYAEDFLSEEDRVHTFDAKEALEKTDKQELCPFPEDLQEIMDSTLRTQEMEGREEIFQPYVPVQNQVADQLEITSQIDTLIPEEKHVETCQEGGNFIKTIEQTRRVSFSPRQMKQEKVCLGHKKKFSAWKKKTLIEEVEAFKKSLEKTEGQVDFTYEIESHFSNLLRSYKTTASWKHLNANRGCDLFERKETTLEEEKEIDHWEASPSEHKLLDTLEGSLSCKLLQIQGFDPGIHTVSGKPIYREAWKQRLIFYCESDAYSRCQKLRDLGGVLLKRTCLEEDDGECLFWEKTYDLGGKAAYTKKQVSFKEADLFKLEEFDPSFEKNQEFGSVISTFSSLTDIGESFSQHVDPMQASVFCGSAAKCRRSFNSDNLFDCCFCQGQGFLIGARLGKCNKEEVDLFEKVKEGKCHLIGKKKSLLLTEHVYCCFPTKLARIVQEEGRKQLRISWGTPEKPLCQGLTLDQIKSLDFANMDFTDFIEGMQEKIDPQKLADKMQTLAKNFTHTLSQDQAKARTEEKIEDAKQKVQNYGDAP